MRDSTPCPICGDEVPPKGATGPRKTYCSKRCRSRADHLRRRESVLATEAAKRAAIRAETMRNCPECGTDFTPSRSMNQMYCSAPCSRRGTQDSRSKTCSMVGCDRPHRAKGMCHMHWRRVARAEGRESVPVWDERRRENYQRRRALKRGADAEQIVNAEVFERDGWVCGICSAPVGRLASWPDPLSASLDHILPLSKGGSHTSANVQLAHLGCNVEKGARVAA